MVILTIIAIQRVESRAVDFTPARSVAAARSLAAVFAAAAAAALLIDPADLFRRAALLV